MPIDVLETVYKFDENYYNKTHKKGFEVAVSHNNLAVVKMLLKRNPKLIGGSGAFFKYNAYSPLRNACYDKQFDMIKLLLKYGAPIPDTLEDKLLKRLNDNRYPINNDILMQSIVTYGEDYSKKRLSILLYEAIVNDWINLVIFLRSKKIEEPCYQIPDTH